MENKAENLRSLLVAIAKHIKINRQLTVYVLTELSALQESVSGLDPTLRDVFAQKKKEIEEKFSLDTQHSLEQADDLIRVIEQADLN